MEIKSKVEHVTDGWANFTIVKWSPGEFTWRLENERVDNSAIRDTATGAVAITKIRGMGIWCPPEFFEWASGKQLTPPEPPLTKGDRVTRTGYSGIWRVVAEVDDEYVAVRYKDTKPTCERRSYLTRVK